jgi:hypothetical protein
MGADGHAGVLQLPPCHLRWHHAQGHRRRCCRHTAHPQHECTVEREGAEALTIELLQPALGGVECGAAGDVLDEERAERAAVVGGGDDAKALLAGGVPDLAVPRGGGGPVLCGSGG